MGHQSAGPQYGSWGNVTGDWASADGLARLVPAAARRVLHLGCGDGELGEIVKRRRKVEVVGVERDAAMAELAQERLDVVIVGDPECSTLDLGDGQFDCVVLGDLLERVDDPVDLLCRLRALISPTGCLLAGVRNVRHRAVLGRLVEGDWSYEIDGLMRGHVRLFTRRGLEKLMLRTGFDLERAEAIPGPGYPEWFARGCPGTVQIGPVHAAGLAQRDAEEFHAAGYHLRARPSKSTDYGLTSIVIVTYNELQYTQACLDSISPPYAQMLRK